MKLESLAQSIPLVRPVLKELVKSTRVRRTEDPPALMFLLKLVPQRPGGGRSTQEALQDVDDWDLTELNPDWDVGDSDAPSPLPLVGHHLGDIRYVPDPGVTMTLSRLPAASLQTKPRQQP